MVDPGQLLLHDSVSPALTDGRYRVGITPTLPAGVPGAAPAAGAFDLLVAGPAPEPGRIRSHPAAGLTGDFADDLPFVLLERRTLPWERAGFGLAGTPWLALVLTRDDGTPEATLVPHSGPADGPAGTLRAADLATQTRLVPRPDEARLLVHVREYNATDAAAGGDDDGWLAVVVANRLPRTPGRWRVTLVSLEGRIDLLSAAPTLGLAALWSVTFTVASAGGSFGARLAAVATTRFADPSLSGSVVDATGAVAITRQDRSGRLTPAFYRSPLAASPAVVAAVLPSAGPLDAPPDVTETAAAELGRLLTAADPRMLAELAAWHRARLQAQSRATQASSMVASPLAPDVLARIRKATPTAASVPDLAAVVSAAALKRWQKTTLPSAGEFGSAAVPFTPGTLRPRPGGGWH